jgi:hypothetical protein
LLVVEPFWMTSRASVAKYGKNTNVCWLRRYHLHRAVYFLYPVSFNQNWQ